MSPTANYYRYIPKNTPDGVYDTPHFGEVYPGRVVEVRPNQTHLVIDHPDWERANRKQFEDQPSVTDHRADLARSPAE